MRARFGRTLTKPNAFLLISVAKADPLATCCFCRSFETSAKRSTKSSHTGNAQLPVGDSSTNRRISNQATDATAADTSSERDYSSDDPPTIEENDHSSNGQTLRLPFRWLNHPYSHPNSQRFDGLSRTQARKQATKMSSVGSPENIWYAERATRPLLLTLDAFDTIFTPRDPVPRQYCEVAAQWGFELSEQEVETSFRKAFKSLSKRSPNYGKSKNMDYRSWWNSLINDTLLPLLPESRQELGVPHDLIDALYSRFSSEAGYTLFPDVLPFLSVVGTSFQARNWAPKRTMLGVLSNSDPRVREILSSFSIDISPSLFPPRHSPHTRLDRQTFGPARFAFATLSYECGHAKPSRMIFDAAERAAQSAFDSLHSVSRLTRSGLVRLEGVREDFHHMHIGDDLDKDVLPALRCGWDAVLLDRRQEQTVGIREIEGHQVTVINNLMALREVVTKDRLELEDGTPRQQRVWLDESRPIVRVQDQDKSNLRGRHVIEPRKLKGRNTTTHPQSPPGHPLDTFD